MKKHLLLLFCIGISLIGYKQEETIKALKEIQAETPKSEHFEEKSFTVEERQSEGYKSIKEIVKSDEIKSIRKNSSLIRFNF